MILLPNKDKAQNIGSKNHRKYAPKFGIYYRPHRWTDNFSAVPEAGYELANLSSDVYAENCKWEGAGDIKLAGTFDGVKKIDVLIFGNPSWNEARGAFYKDGEIVFNMRDVFWATENGAYIRHRGGRIIFNRKVERKTPLCRRLAPEEEALDITDQNIIIIPLYIEADGFEFIFDGAGSLNKLYMGLETQITMPHSVSYGIKGNAQGGITNIGVVYGAKYKPTRTFGAAWDLEDDGDRRTLERYMLEVQTVVPHYIAPVKEHYYIPPMFAALSDDKLGNKKRAQSWHWDGVELAWTEVN